MSGLGVGVLGGERVTTGKKFYRLEVAERLGVLADELDFGVQDLPGLGCPDPLPLEVADQLVENVVGVVPLPLGVARHFVVDGVPVAVPMATEEPSVVAAASHGAKLLSAAGGIRTTADSAHMIGQIFLCDVQGFEGAARRLSAVRTELLAAANVRHPNLRAAGGGARGFELRVLEARSDGWIIVFELLVDVRDAMGANVVNSMCEAIAPRVAELAGGRVGMRILTNLCDRRCVRAEGTVPASLLGGEAGVKGIEEASLFAELDAYRACTHNKGIMNGVDAVLAACGQDWRAAEAGAHAFAARDGRYGPLATWSREPDGGLRGRIELPLAVGVVGKRARVNPAVDASLQLLGEPSADRLARVAAAAGLAQNLAALRALTQEGILRGHLKLHHRVSTLSDRG